MLETQAFEQERQPFQWKHWSGLLFLVLSNITKVMEQGIRYTRFFDKYGARDLIFSLGSKKSRTKISKIEATVPKKIFGPFFLLLPTMIDIEYSFFRLHKVAWQKWCKLWDHFFGSLKGCLKHIFFEKRQSFQSRNVFALYFFDLSNLTNLRKGFTRAKKIWQLVWK